MHFHFHTFSLKLSRVLGFDWKFLCVVVRNEFQQDPVRVVLADRNNRQDYRVVVSN